MAEPPTKRRMLAKPAGRKPLAAKAAHPTLPALDEITPARFARLNSLQRRELTLKLIEFLKSL